MSEFLSDYAACFTADGCGLNIGDGTTLAAPVTCGTISNCRLYLTSSSDNDRSSYQHSVSGNTITPYTRVVRMERTPASGTVREIKVTSTVTWRTGSLISGQRVEAVSYLFNVYDTN